MRSITVPVVLLLSTHSNLAEEAPTLASAFAPHFRVGTALGTHQIAGREPKVLELASRQFNAVTPENCLKWQSVHPDPDRYEFSSSDAFVDWGTKHDQFLVGHTLVWHSQTPRWVSQGVDGEPLDRETALARMKEHIDTVVGRYKGRIRGWDVVNEAIDDEGRLRSSGSGTGDRRGAPWYAPIGEDFVEKAFESAHAADPDAELYYNDYNEWIPAKIEAISNLVRRLQSKKIRIDGIGLQGHWGLDYPTLEEIDHMLTEYGKLGVKIMITELDVTVLPRPTRDTGADVGRRAEGEGGLAPYRDGLSESAAKALADRYEAVFRLFVEHASRIDRVTFWGVHDGQSWRNFFPVRGRTDHPLLFDRELRPKAAFSAVLGTAKTGAAAE